MNLNQALSFFDLKKIPSQLELKKLYHEKAKKLHPDAGGSQASFLFLKESYDYLKTFKKLEEFHSFPQVKKENPEFSNSSIFKQQYDFKTICLMIFFFMSGYKLTTYCGYRFLSKKEKTIIFSKFENENKVLNFKLKKYQKCFSAKKGWNKIDKNLFLFFV